MPSDTAVNVIGAFARALVDAIEESTTATVGQDSTATAALVHLSKYEGENINALRAPLDLSHPGCVRLVDRLERDDLVVRTGAPDGRAVTVELTPSGGTAARTILRKRRDTLRDPLSVLSAQELQLLGRLAGKVLTRIVRDESQALRVCRICDYRVCPDGVCPVGVALEHAAPA